MGIVNRAAPPTRCQLARVRLRDREQPCGASAESLLPVLKTGSDELAAGFVRDQQPAAAPATSKWWPLPRQTARFRSTDGAPCCAAGSRRPHRSRARLFQLAPSDDWITKAVAVASQEGAGVDTP
jgi:hypothetical protein